MIVDEATSQVETWLDLRPPSSPSRRRGTPACFAGCCATPGPPANLTIDAHIAALAIEHGAEIVFYDRDFARFAGVRHRLPEATAARSGNFAARCPRSVALAEPVSR